MLVENVEEIYKETDSVYDSVMKILQQGYNIRESFNLFNMWKVFWF